MSDRLSVSLATQEEEKEIFLAPFRRVGSSDPVIAEFRQALREGEPEWAQEKTWPELLNQRHFEDLKAAFEIKIERLSALPDGQARNTALARAQEAKQLAEKLIEEIAFAHPAAD